MLALIAGAAAENRPPRFLPRVPMICPNWVSTGTVALITMAIPGRRLETSFSMAPMKGPKAGAAAWAMLTSPWTMGTSPL